MRQNPRVSALVTILAVVALGTGFAQEPAPLAEAQGAASVLALEKLREADGRAYDRVRGCPDGAILLVDGRHDHTDRVLGGLGIRFRRCSDRDFGREALERTRLLIIDCPGEIGPEGAERTRRYVGRGGTLLTTDWALLHVLEAAFPDKVRWTRRSTRDDVVRITEVRDDPLVRHLFPRDRLASWWIENLSHPVEILDRSVRPLLVSDEMARRYGHGALALTFRHGRGRVVHIVSHTYLQRNTRVHPWESRSAEDEAEACGLPTASEGYKRLRAGGGLARIAAGDLNAALSAHAFVLNVLASSLDEPEGIVRETPPVTSSTPLDSSESSVATVRTGTSLRSSPGGDPVLRVNAGLSLEILEVHSGSARVRTPAGQTGWIALDAVDRR